MGVPPPEVPRGIDELSRRHPDVDLFARIEDLIGEEEALLMIPAEERGPRDHQRLRAIEDELDRIFEKLRLRDGRRRAAPGKA
jgi:hypothetical protein